MTIFYLCRQGAEALDGTSSDSGNKPSAFRGAGYRLGTDDNDSERKPFHCGLLREVINNAIYILLFVVIPDDKTRSGTKPSAKGVTLKMWKNGFSVDDGPLREYGDPDNKDFLESIRKGFVLTYSP